MAPLLYKNGVSAITLTQTLLESGLEVNTIVNLGKTALCPPNIRITTRPITMVVYC